MRTNSPNNNYPPGVTDDDIDRAWGEDPFALTDEQIRKIERQIEIDLEHEAIENLKDFDNMDE